MQDLQDSDRRRLAALPPAERLAQVEWCPFQGVYRLKRAAPMRGLRVVGAATVSLSDDAGFPADAEPAPPPLPSPRVGPGVVGPGLSGSGLPPRPMRRGRLISSWGWIALLCTGFWLGVGIALCQYFGVGR